MRFNRIWEAEIMSLEKRKCIECWKAKFPAPGFKKRDGLLKCKKLGINLAADRESFCTFWREATADGRRKEVKISARDRRILSCQMSVKQRIRRRNADRLHEIQDKIK